MEQITYTKTYQEYKQELDTELSKTAEGFVRIGYLLKVARDTEILAESGYTTVTEFAKAEYGIDKTMVSRFISINDKFAEGGYSDQLQEQYKGYGYAKLTLMLTLPDEINQQLSPAYSKAEIQAIKDEVDEEKNVSDLEVMMEQPAASTATGTGDTLLDRLIRQLGEDSPDLYVQMAFTTPLQGEEQIRATKETMAPNGEKQYSIRISGIGRYMVSIRDTEDTITATSLRTMEQHTYDYPALLAAWAAILPPSNGKPDTEWTAEQIRTSWELEYGREYPIKAEVAPVQPKKTGKTECAPAPRKESKVQKAPKPMPAAPAPAAPPIQPTPEPEMPESTGTETTNGETYTTGVHLPTETGTEAAGQPIREPETEEPLQEQKSDITEPEKPESTGMGENTPENQQEEQLPGQIGMEEAIEEAKKRAISYTESDISQTAAGQDMDAEWEKVKKQLYDQLQRMNTPGMPSSVDLSRQAREVLKGLRENLINMAALIEKELLRRGEEF